MSPPPSRPLLVLVGRGLDGMEQVAASVRRRGVETAWIGMPYGPHLRARARLFCDHVATATTPAEVAAALRRWGPERVVDVMCTEAVVDRVAEGARMLAGRPGAGLPAAVLEDLDRRRRLTDKYAMRTMLAAAGVRVPAAYDAAEVPADRAAAELGLPLMVKGARGQSGLAVRLAGTVEEAQRAAEELRGEDGVYYEQRIEGVESGAGLAVAGGRILQRCAFRSRKSDQAPLAFPVAVTPQDRPDVLAVAAQVAAAVGLRGLLNLDVITDAEGRIWVLDVNMRPWHTTVAVRAAGVDFVAGYLHALGVGPAPAPPTTMPAGPDVAGFPREGAELTLREPREGPRLLVRQARQYRHWTGPGYLAAAVFRVGMTIGARVYRDLVDSGHPIGRHLPALGEYRRQPNAG